VGHAAGLHGVGVVITVMGVMVALMRYVFMTVSRTALSGAAFQPLYDI
jgi:hypothetical protein